MHIDLSHAINSDMPIFPADPRTVVDPSGNLERDGYIDHLVSIGTHAGTHIDAPMHMIAGGKNLADYPVGRFIGRGRLINGFSLQAVQQASLQPGDIVLFNTGFSDHWLDEDYFTDWPVMTRPLADYLVQQKVSMVGVDTAGVDGMDSTEIHTTLLGGDVLIIENLTNLAQLVDKEFIVYALPIKLEVDGAPARVVATVL